MQALSLVNVDVLAAVMAAAPAAVAAAEQLILHNSHTQQPRALPLSMAVLVAAAALSTQFPASADVTAWLALWLLSATVYITHSCWSAKAVRLPPYARIFHESALSGGLCLVLVLLLDASAVLQWFGQIDGSTLLMLATACALSFGASFCAWSLREAAAASAASYAALSALAALLAVLVNAFIWDQHGPAAATLLLLIALALAGMPRSGSQAASRASQSRSSSETAEGGSDKGHGAAGSDPLSSVWGVLASAAAVGAMLWMFAAAASAAQTSTNPTVEHSRQQLGQELSLVTSELKSLKTQAVKWEQAVVHNAQHQLAAAVHATGGSSSSRNSSMPALGRLKYDPGAAASSKSSSSSSSSSPAAAAATAAAPSPSPAAAAMPVATTAVASPAPAATPATNITASKQTTAAATPAAATTAAATPAAAAATAATSAFDPEYIAKLRKAVEKPINVLIMTGVFWTITSKSTENCSVDGVPLKCNIWQDQSEEHLNAADALYYHVPSFSGMPMKKRHPNQLRLAMSLESASYYQALDSPEFMCHFDAEMTYRQCAQVTNWYSLESFDELFKFPLVPFEEKQHAIAYVNSNCGAVSGRSSIMKALMALNGSKVPVHSLGNCDHNTPWPKGNPNKRQVFSKYKFCVTMENSLAHDYVTEKLWDGLAAGCVPIYLGSPSALQMAPDASSIIMYDPKGKGNASTVEQLDALMHEIGSNKERYEKMLAWKHKKVEEQPSPLFKYLWDVRKTSGECFLCQFLARHRANPKPRYTTCLFNETWMAAAGQELKPQPGCE
uniref:Fucosyltransferase n=1 Tax=Tetradesmus obliquus TaxID=3088 RepID=A0A383W9Z5_TETOB|eukprot:jgi/Sobl393_1/13013/SZX74281.1